MTSIPDFDTHVHCEELYGVSEAEYDEVMSLMAEDGDGWQGYAEWSAALDATIESENFVVRNGRVYHKPEPRSMGRIGGYEL